METLTDLERDCLARAVRHIIGSKDKDERFAECRFISKYGNRYCIGVRV